MEIWWWTRQGSRRREGVDGDMVVEQIAKEWEEGSVLMKIWYGPDREGEGESTDCWRYKGVSESDRYIDINLLL